MGLLLLLAFLAPVSMETPLSRRHALDSVSFGSILRSPPQCHRVLKGEILYIGDRGLESKIN